MTGRHRRQPQRNRLGLPIQSPAEQKRERAAIEGKKGKPGRSGGGHKLGTSKMRAWRRKS
jgi:hypothetical protein